MGVAKKVRKTGEQSNLCYFMAQGFVNSFSWWWGGYSKKI